VRTSYILVVNLRFLHGSEIECFCVKTLIFKGNNGSQYTDIEEKTINDATLNKQRLDNKVKFNYLSLAQGRIESIS
jgi:hypothetical protein